MLKFTLKALILLSLFLLIDRVIGNFIFYVGQTLKGDKRFEHIIRNKNKTDILILGSSRSARDIIASELTYKTKLSAYNLGFPGSNIDFHMQLLKLIIDNEIAPKFIVLAVDDYSELIEEKSLSFRYDIL